MKILKKIWELLKKTIFEVKDAYLYALKSENKIIKTFFGYIVPLYFVCYLIVSTISAIVFIATLLIGCMVIIGFLEDYFNKE